MMQEIFDKAFSTKRDEILRLRETGDLTFKEFILYGSYAKGKQTGRSDIDILLVYDEEPSQKEKILLYLLPNHEAYPNIDVLPRSSMFMNKNGAFQNNVKDGGITIWKQCN